MCWLSTIAKEQDLWLRIVKSYGISDPKDLVQDLYIKLSELSTTKLSPTDGRRNPNYVGLTPEERFLDENGNPQKRIIQKILKGMIHNHFNANKKNIVFCTDLQELEHLLKTNKCSNKEFNELTTEVYNTLLKTDRYLARVYYHYTDIENPSIRTLSEATGISAKTIRRDLTKIKTIISLNTQEKYNEFKEQTA